MSFTFLLLTKNSLYSFCKNNKNSQLSFPHEVVAYQEIANRTSFDALLTQYLAAYSKYEAILLLSNDIIFQKILPLSPQTNIADEEKKFIDLIPFAPSNVASIIIKSTNALKMYATNTDIYKTIFKVAQLHAITIKHVVPLSPFSDVLENKPLSFETLSQIRKDKKLLNRVDFLLLDIKNTHSSTLLKRLLLLLAIPLITGLLIFIFLFIVKK